MSHNVGTQSIDRAAKLLVRVVENSEPTSVGSLAEATGLPKSTTSRLVRALERQGLVQRDGARGNLSPGPVLLRFAQRGGERDLPALAHDTLRRLAAETGETINLAVAGPFGVEQIAQEDSRHFVGGTNWVGRRVPYHASANGKVLLAWDAAALPQGELERLTPHTIVDRRALEAELAAIRERGYATAVDELEPGLSAVAAPVGDGIAAVSVSGPTMRMSSARLEELGALLVHHAAELSALLDHDHHEAKRGAA